MLKTPALVTAVAALPVLLHADPGTPSIDPDSDYMKAGAASYALVCAGCHQPQGQGIPGAFPPLTNSQWLGGDPTRAIKIVLNGLAGPLEVAGQSYNLMMPPQGPLLDDLKLAQVLTYTRNSFGNAYDPVTPAQVKALREQFGDRVEYWNAEELLALHPLEGEPGELTDGDHPLRDMQFATYDGSWNKLPDFSNLEPTKTGKLKGNKPDVAARKGGKDNFGIRFSGKIEVPVDGEFAFTLASDDGSRLTIDGVVVIDHDGVHGMSSKDGKIRLRKGSYPIVLDYFEKGGGEELELSWSGPGFKDKPLSNRGAKRTGVKTGMPLGPDGMVARHYRNFIQGAGPRAIGVGYPGAINLAWDAANMRPALLWRGPFMDAARHWSGRGQGFQPPANPNHLTLHDGTPIALLDSPNDPWPTDDERKNDKLRTSKFVFRGYSTDKNNWPTFRYSYGDLEATDYYAPVNNTPDVPLDQTATDTFSRTLTVSGDFPVIYHRAAVGEIEQLSPTSFQVDDAYRIDLKNADPRAVKPLLRPVDGNRQELVIAAKPGKPIVTTITLLQ